MSTIHARATDNGATQAPEDLQRTQGGTRRRLLATLPVTERRLRLNGIWTAVLEGGEGPPVVLLHGPGEYAAKWLRVIPDLAKTHHVIAPDLPGHGDSAVIHGPVDVERVLAWLDELVACTCQAPAALVGHVLGGAIAARFASARGERLAGLVLVDTLGLAPFQPAPEFATALGGFLARPTQETHDQLWQRCAFDLDGMRSRMGEQWANIKAYNLDRARTPALQPTQRGLMEQFGMPPIAAAELAGIAVPTALIWGRHDLATSLSVARAASTRYGWPLHVIEGAADDPPMEQPEAFLHALRRALERSPSGSAEPETPDSRASWDRIAPGYDSTNTPTQMAIASRGLQIAGLRPGMRFLDVAAGSGALAIPAARLGARVTAIDQSPVMLELLAARARSEGLLVETLEMDGHALQFDGESFDITGSQFGVMLFPDMPRAIREMVRVTRSGGKVLVHAYGDPGRVEFLGFLVAAVQAVRPDFNGPPSEPPPLEFQLAEPQRLRRELTAAGLQDVDVHTVTETTEHETGKGLWEWLVSSNPLVERVLGGMLNLSGHERAVVQDALEQLVRQRAGGDRAAKLTNPVNIGVGTK